MNKLFLTIVCFLFSGPLLFSQTKQYDLGVIEVSEKKQSKSIGTVFDKGVLRIFFDFQNRRPFMIDNIDVSTDCDCLPAKFSRTSLGPGEKMRIDIGINIKGFRGPFSTTYKIAYKRRDKDYHQLLTVNYQVKGEVKEHKPGYLAKMISTKGCRSCHVDSGKDKYGKELFQSLCSPCHGREAQGGWAPSFQEEEFFSKSYDPNAVRRLILEGHKDEKIPGFSQEKGGPLNKKQVDSLLKFYEDLKEDFGP